MSQPRRVTDIVLLVLACLTTPVAAQTDDALYDEAQVPPYELPDPLIASDGTPITTPEQWWELRRPEIMEVFQSEMYGRVPKRPSDFRFETFSEDPTALGGTATRKQVRIYFDGDRESPAMDLLVYLPNAVRGPVPLFLGLNFGGNHTIHPDPEIRLPQSYTGPDGEEVVASEADRGRSASRWPVESIVARGFGLATAFYEDIDPDFDDGFGNGVHGLYRTDGENERAPDAWGSVAAWAWGLSRAMDYLETDERVEEEQVVLMGHSRLGKAALWAGAVDPRFYFVVSNNSGEGGAAITRRRYGERISHLNDRFPHWFAANFRKYVEREDELPVDQHMLLALIAPRSVYVTSAVDDRWADPRGEFLAALHADPVYRLLLDEGLNATEMPEIARPVHSRIGYHIRSGGHDVTAYDWEQWMDWVETIAH